MLQPDLRPAWGHAFETVRERCGLKNARAVDRSSFGGGHLAFAPQIESRASAGYRAVARDMPGHGRRVPIEPCAFKSISDQAPPRALLH